MYHLPFLFRPKALLSAGDDSRFTDALAPDQRAELGFAQLSSDNIAVLNALVRQDESTFKLRKNTIATTRFSERRTSHEREIMGLGLLDAEQVAKLDALVGRRFVPVVTTRWMESSGLPSGVAISSVDTLNERRRPDIRGSFSFTYGWGKGGSVMGGDVNLIYRDPERRYSVMFGYSQYEGKGYLPWLDPTDPYYYYRARPVPELGDPWR